MTRNCFASRSGGYNAEEWFITVDDEVVELKKVTDWNQHVKNEVMKQYDANLPVGEGQRIQFAGAFNASHTLDDVLAPKESSNESIDGTLISISQHGLDPWPVIRGFLLQLSSRDVPELIDRAGLLVNWTLTEKQDYSHKLRLAAYRPRIDSAYQLLSNEDRLKVAFIVANEIASRGLASQLDDALHAIGWRLHERRLMPVAATIRQLFFPDQSQHDAYIEIRGILQQATTSISVVDPYVDQSILSLFSTCLREGLSFHLLTSKVPADFPLEASKWVAQHGTTTLEVRRTKEFHDRFVVLDDATCYHVGCSIKDAGNRAFMLSQVEDEGNRSALLAQIEKSWNAGLIVL